MGQGQATLFVIISHICKPTQVHKYIHKYIYEIWGMGNKNLGDISHLLDHLWTIDGLATCMYVSMCIMHDHTCVLACVCASTHV